MAVTTNRPPAYPTVTPYAPVRAGSAREAKPDASVGAKWETTSERPRVVVRPTSVKVLSVLGLAHAGLIVVTVMLGLVMLLTPGVPKLATVAVTKADPFLKMWSISSAILSLMLAVVLVFSSISLKALRPWARKGMIFWALAWLFLSVGGLVIDLGYAFAQMEKSGLVAGEALMIAKLVRAGGAIALGVAWPITIVICLHSKWVKEAFERAAVAGKAAII